MIVNGFRSQEDHLRSRPAPGKLYLEAVKAAHERLDRLLQQPPETWPRAEMIMEFR